MSLFPFVGFGDSINYELENQKIQEKTSSGGCVHTWKKSCETEAFTYYVCTKCKEEKREYS